MTEISFVIPVYHALEETKVCLRSIENIKERNKAEIIIVNDCPGSKTSEFLHDYAKGHDVKLIDNPKNIGFIGSCNRGMMLAQSSIVVLLNSDTEVPVSIVDKFVKCYNSDEKIACAGPLGSAIEKRAFVGDVNSADMCAEQKSGINKYIDTLVPNGFCFGVRKSIINEIGGYDPIFGKGYCEENDLSYRALKNGYRNVVITDLFVLHKGSASFGSNETRQRIKENKKILNKRWGTFIKEYKKQNNELYKQRIYIRRFYPWYMNFMFDLRKTIIKSILWALPKSELKNKLKGLK